MMTAITHEFAMAEREFNRQLGPDALMDDQAMETFNSTYAQRVKHYNNGGTGMPIDWAERTWRHQMLAHLADVLLQQAMTAEFKRMLEEHKAST